VTTSPWIGAETDDLRARRQAAVTLGVAAGCARQVRRDLGMVPISCETLPFNIASRCPLLSVPSGRSRDGVPTVCRWWAGAMTT